ncbi:hypothetical protein HaLaN_09276 [Haematococcus lacustris]|uniref:Uncharacterized protein n=1 Tax=Haematococcus lacustris TaxID=44745 RepID=A0A699YUA4_HAELA|nr:hypothetical protein HaLaN_09276 [Haematococcus lacustris]
MPQLPKDLLVAKRPQKVVTSSAASEAKPAVLKAVTARRVGTPVPALGSIRASLPEMKEMQRELGDWERSSPPAQPMWQLPPRFQQYHEIQRSMALEEAGFSQDEIARATGHRDAGMQRAGSGGSSIQAFSDVDEDGARPRLFWATAGAAALLATAGSLWMQPPQASKLQAAPSPVKASIPSSKTPASTTPAPALKAAPASSSSPPPAATASAPTAAGSKAAPAAGLAATPAKQGPGGGEDKADSKADGKAVSKADEPSLPQASATVAASRPAAATAVAAVAAVSPKPAGGQEGSQAAAAAGKAAGPGASATAEQAVEGKAGGAEGGAVKAVEVKAAAEAKMQSTTQGQQGLSAAGREDHSPSQVAVSSQGGGSRAQGSSREAAGATAASSPAGGDAAGPSLAGPSGPLLASEVAASGLDPGMELPGGGYINTGDRV